MTLSWHACEPCREWKARHTLQTSRSLLAATPTAHWLEYVDWADAIVQEPLEIASGMAIVPDRPGSGLTWDDAAVRRYRMR